SPDRWLPKPASVEVFFADLRAMRFELDQIRGPNLTIEAVDLHRHGLCRDPAPGPARTARHEAHAQIRAQPAGTAIQRAEPGAGMSLADAVDQTTHQTRADAAPVPAFGDLDLGNVRLVAHGTEADNATSRHGDAGRRPSGIDEAAEPH